MDWTIEHFCLRCECKMRSRIDEENVGLSRYHANGLCMSCYDFERKKTSATRRKNPEFDEVGQVCNKCKIYQSYENFNRSKMAKSGYNYLCKTCSNLYKYNISRAEFQNMVEQQDNRCKICFREGEDFNNNFHVDHDHSCCPQKGSCGKCVRGLLCPSCNHGLGHFKDSIRNLERAIAYLKGE